MRNLFILGTFIFILSCDSDEIKEEINCSLSSGNGIENLDSDGIAEPDLITMEFDNLEFKLKGRSYSVTHKFYDNVLAKRTVQFVGDNGESVTCKISFYYPGDSSFFNNSDYLTTFGTGDFAESETLVGDSLNFDKHCSFGFFMELQTQSGQIFRTKAHDPDQANFFIIDSIKYVDRVFDYAQFQVFGHFEVILFDNITSQNKSVSGEVVMLFETEK